MIHRFRHAVLIQTLVGSIIFLNCVGDVSQKRRIWRQRSPEFRRHAYLEKALPGMGKVTSKVGRTVVV
jgi:hypothetical protein